MKKKLIKLLLILLFPSLIQACLWLEGTTIDGTYYKTFGDESISSMFLKMSQAMTPQQNFKNKFYRENNQTVEYIALYQIMKGEYQQGIEKLLKIESQSPNLYSTASNLGTAYELQGNIPLAIKWIKEGIKRDAQSHYGTEWLHLLILETKLELENNPNLLKNSHILNLPSTFNKRTPISIKGKDYTIDSIRDALFYQLKERMIFVKPQDKVVADLLYTFAKIEEQTTVVEEASILMDMAEKYGFSNQKEIDSLYHNANEAISNLRRNIVLISFIIIITLIVLITIAIRQMKKRKKGLVKKRVISPLSFALSINVYILIFTLLSLPIYGYIHIRITNIIMLYIILIPIYPLSINRTIRDIKKRYTIPPNPSQHIRYSTILYIFFSTLIYFYFLKNFGIDALYHFGASAILSLIVFYFLKWRINN